MEIESIKNNKEDDETIISVDLLDDSDDVDGEGDSSRPKVFTSDDSVTVVPNLGINSKFCSPPTVSPATQTLNILSQNMEDLRYDMSHDMSQLSKHSKDNQTKSIASCPQATSSPTTTSGKNNNNIHGNSNNPPDYNTAKKSLPKKKRKVMTEKSVNTVDLNETNSLNWKQYEVDWSIHPVYIDEMNGTLGMVIEESAFPFKSKVQNQITKHCCVLRVVNRSLAEKGGIQPGDWICHSDSKENDPILASFVEVQEWSHHRPFHVCVLRRRSNNSRRTSMKNDITTPNAKSKTKTISTDRNLFKSDPKTSKNHEESNDGEKNNFDCASSVNKCNNRNVSRPSSYKRNAADDSKNERNKKQQQMQSRTDQITVEGTSNRDKKINQEKRGPTKGRELIRNRVVTPGTVTVKPPSEKNDFRKAKRKRINTNIKHNRDRNGTIINSKVPFCHFCNGRIRSKAKSHHAWCPKNEFFENSGAQELLRRIQQGTELGCTACEAEFAAGRLGKKKHISTCLENQVRLKREEEEREKEEEEKEKRNRERKKSSRSNGRSKLKPQRRWNEYEMNGDSIESSHDEDDDDDDSIYRPSNRHPIRTLSIQDSTANIHQTSSLSKDKSQQTLANIPSVQEFDQGSPTYNQRKDTLQSNWVSFSSNPWGRAGHVFGDVLLYGMASGLGNYDTQCPDRRFTSCPFSNSSSYRFTHTSPQEGLSMLMLTRDPLASHPWGFRVCRDEFGHACLVESVDPLSLASSARYIGTQASDAPAGLCVNDMLLAINGKVVGGMTQVGVELELDICSPNLVLVVSRYKHANDVAKKFAETEFQMLQVMDNAAKDNRMIGWLEVGNARPDLRITDQEIKVSNSDGRFVENWRRRPAESERRHSEHSIEDAAPRGSDVDNSNSNGMEEFKPIHFEFEATNGEDNFHRQKSKVPRSAKSDDDSSMNWNDDQNAWLGCVCGKVHSKSAQGVFWIQCEACQSWYDVSSTCVGFTATEVEHVRRWTCWACPSSDVELIQKSTALTRVEQDATEFPSSRCTQSSQDVDSGSLHSTSQVQAIESNGRESKTSPQSSHNPNSSSPILQKKLACVDSASDSQSTLNIAEAKEINKNTQKPKRDIFSNRRTADGCILPKTKPIKQSDGSFMKPSGRTLKNMRWDAKKGLWVPKVTPKKQNLTWTLRNR